MSQHKYGDWRVRAGAVFGTMFGLGLVLRLFGPFGRAPAAELRAYAAVACLGFALLTWGLLDRETAPS
jgi:hypothetical protein